MGRFKRNFDYWEVNIEKCSNNICMRYASSSIDCNLYLLNVSGVNSLLNHFLHGKK